MDTRLCDQLFDLRNCVDLVWDEGENAISSVGDSPGVFPQNWLPPHLSYTGLLEVIGLYFDAIVWSLFCAAESVRFSIKPIMSDVTEDGDGIPMTTSARSWGGESGCSEWLQFVLKGARPMAPPTGVCLCTVVFFQNGGMVYIWTVCTWRESVGVLQVTG